MKKIGENINWGIIIAADVKGKTDAPFVRIFAELNRGDTHQGRFM